MIEPPDPAVAARMRKDRAKAAGLEQMLRKHCRFEFVGGAKVKQRRIGDRTAAATFTVTRPDGEERTFHHGLVSYMRAHRFATAEHVEKSIDVKDHPLMQAAVSEGSAAS